MDNIPPVCPRCKQASVPMAEFCRHCGEPLRNFGNLAQSSFLGRTTGFFIAAMFWAVDEIVRWWEIGRISRQLQVLRRRRTGLINSVSKQATDSGADGETQLSADERAALLRLSDDISRLSGREEFLRERSWALTPELLLVALIVLFITGVVWLRPSSKAALLQDNHGPMLDGGISLVTTIPLQGFEIVRAATYFQGSLFIGGDGGLVAFNAAYGLASTAIGLPPGFFVRDLTVSSDSLLIAGYGGVFCFAGGEARPLYTDERLPVALINRIGLTRNGEHLLGTIGHGLLRGNNKVAVMMLGTQGIAVQDFAWLDGELWLLHDRGLLRGDGETFAPHRLQVLTDREIRCLASEKDAIFLGTDEGVIAGYRNGRNWVWTVLAPGKPRRINHLVSVDGVLLIGADEGLFRFKDGHLEKLDDTPVTRIAVGPTSLAAVNAHSIVIFALQPLQAPTPTVKPVFPTVGSFVVTPQSEPETETEPNSDAPPDLEPEPDSQSEPEPDSKPEPDL